MGICTEIPSDEDWDSEGSDSDSDSHKSVVSDSSEYRSDSESSGSDSKDTLNFSSLSLNDGSEGRSEAMVAMAMLSKTKYWKPGKVIRIRFIGGEREVREKVTKYAKIWEEYANIKFKFVRKEPSHIRISFDRSLGTWSLVGTDARRMINSEATMNLAVSSRTSRKRLKRSVLHEFGHALGCVHEHSSPACGIKWDRKAVYAYYKKSQRWSKEKVDKNVLKKYDKRTVTQFSKFDPHSIMIYNIPSKFTTNGVSVRCNSDLSPTDKKFIAKVYPKESRRRR